MAQKTNGRPKLEGENEESVVEYTPSETVQNAIKDFHTHKARLPKHYTEIIKALFEKSRKRVATYYCPNTSCKGTFWDSEQGYECPRCGFLGIISEYKYSNATNDTRERNIIGYIDTLGRLFCSGCILDTACRTKWVSSYTTTPSRFALSDASYAKSSSADRFTFPHLTNYLIHRLRQ